MISTMARLIIVLLLGVCTELVSCDIQHLKPGDTFVSECFISRKDRDGLVRIFKDETTVKMFGSGVTMKRKYIANETEIEPSLQHLGDHYSVRKDPDKHTLILTIKNVAVGDAGVWGCIKYSGGLSVPHNMDELVVEGPLLGLSWREHSSIGKPKVEPDGAYITYPEQDRFTLYCVVKVTNTQPEVHITLGRYGEEGTRNLSVDSQIFTHSEIKDGGNTSMYSLQTTLRFSVFIAKRDILEGKPLYCRATTPSKTLERSVRLKARVLPGSVKCSPYNNYAKVGMTNVKLSCVINVDPEPFVNWNLLSGELLNSTASFTGYAVKNEMSEDGTFTSTLTIKEVSSDDFGFYKIFIKNSYGKGGLMLKLIEGDDPNAKAVRGRASILLVAALVTLLHLCMSLF